MKQTVRVIVMKKLLRLAILCLLAAFSSVVAYAQTTEFTYQGRFTDAGQNPSGSYDFEFKLFDAETGGTEIGTQQRLGVSVANGVFSVRLDFGASFNGQPRFLEIAARASGTQGAFTTLTPRQSFTSTPYAIKSLEAVTATNAAQLGGVDSNQFVVTNDPRMTNERNPAPNSPNYIQNTTTTQSNSNFSISGSGTLGGTLSADTVNAVTQFNLGGRRILGITGTSNLFVGTNSGGNTSGDQNSFFGNSSGGGNLTGSQNSFFGAAAGISNTSGSANAYFGHQAGAFNVTGFANSFFGTSAGRLTTGGSDNAFFGAGTGGTVRDGNNITLIGARTDAANNLSFATALGSGARVSTSNTVVLGRTSDTVEIPGSLVVTGSTNLNGEFSANRLNTLTDIAVNGQTVFKTLGNSSIFVGINAGAANTTGVINVFAGHNAGESNTIGSNNSFFGNRAGRSNTSGSFNTFVGFGAGASSTVGLFNSFFGSGAGDSNVDGGSNTFVGFDAGRANTGGSFNVFGGLASGFRNLTGSNNVFLGTSAGKTNSVGSNNTVIGNDADVAGTDLTFATAVGAGAIVSSSNTIQLGRPADTVNVSGFVTLQTLGLGGSQVLCRNGSLQIGICSSSLRYKTNITPFTSGLNLVRRLRPITFDWKTDGTHDLGLVAEEVAGVEPLLITYNTRGEVEGVKYDRVAVVLLNAVKEQQAQIEMQQKLIEQQQALIDELKKIVCGQNTNANVCRRK